MYILAAVLYLTLVVMIVIGALMWRESRDEKKENRELTQKNKSLAEHDASKSEFLSFATHQLKSPLTSLKWGLAALKESYDESIVIKLQTTIDDMISTVTDLLDISKIEQGGMAMSREEFDLHDFVGRIVEEFQAAARDKGIRLVYTGDIVPCIVFADMTKLRQVFVNLVDNAVKYTKKGDVKVVFRRQGQWAEVSVWDTGPGIAPAEQRALFDKFLRGAAGKASEGGSGLGLYLAKEIAMAHGGDISARSEGLGKGSVFSVRLPITRSLKQS